MIEGPKVSTILLRIMHVSLTKVGADVGVLVGVDVGVLFGVDVGVLGKQEIQKLLISE